MPTNHGRKTIIQLSVAELDRVSTQNPRNKQCLATTSNINKIDLEFIESSKDATLTEEPLGGKDGYQIQFLGKHEDMFFSMVRAGKDFFNPRAIGKGNRRPAKTVRQQKTDKPTVYDQDDDETAPNLPLLKSLSDTSYSPPIIPHALCITVFLSKISYSDVHYENGLKKVSTHDIKIDVFFNGDFVDSQIINHKQFNCSGNRGMKARTIRFTGQKLSRMIEKPWVFVPPAQTSSRASSDYSQQDRVKGAEADLRWSSISKNLLVEADAIGRNEFGDRRVLGQYLESLASLPMPPELGPMQEINSLAFGVIDVVVSWGSGHKNGPDNAYLTKPTRSLPKRLNIKSNKDSPEGDFQESNEDTISPASTSDNSAMNTSMPSNCDAIPIEPVPEAVIRPQVIVPQTRDEALATALTLDGTCDESPKLPHHIIKELVPPDRSHTGTPRRQREPSATEDSKPPRKRRKALEYHHVLTDKPTLSEQWQTITENALTDFQKRRTRATVTQPQEAFEVISSPLSSPPSKSEEVSVIETPKRRKILTLKISPEKLTNSPSNIALPASEGASRQQKNQSMPFRSRRSINSSTTTSTSSTTSSPSQPNPIPLSPAPIHTKAAKTSHGYAQASSPIPLGKTAQLTFSKEVFDAEFAIPKLCEGSCITYAEPGVIRNVGAVRGGWFEEMGVVMGSRFIVG